MDETIKNLENTISDILHQVRIDCGDVQNAYERKLDVEAVINNMKKDLASTEMQILEIQKNFKEFENHFQVDLMYVQATKEEILNEVEKNSGSFTTKTIEKITDAFNELNVNIELVKQIYDLVLSKMNGLNELEKNTKSEFETIFDSYSELENELSKTIHLKNAKDEMLQETTKQVQQLKSSRNTSGEEDETDELKQQIICTLQNLHSELENSEKLSAQNIVSILDGPLELNTIKVVASSLEDLEVVKNSINESLDRLLGHHKTLKDEQLKKVRDTFLPKKTSTSKKKPKAKSIVPKQE